MGLQIVMNISILPQGEQILFPMKHYEEPLMFLIMECLEQVIVTAKARLNPVLSSGAVLFINTINKGAGPTKSKMCMVRTNTACLLKVKQAEKSNENLQQAVAFPTEMPGNIARILFSYMLILSPSSSHQSSVLASPSEEIICSEVQRRF